MSLLQNIATKFRPQPTDVNGIDFGASGIKVVRIRKSGADLSVLAAETHPPLDFSQGPLNASALHLSAKAQARYAAICLNSPALSLKLLTLPGAIDAAFDQKLARNLGLPEETQDRMGYRIIAEGTGRAESRVLAVALPEPEISNCMHIFSSGLPAPWACEASPIAALTAFEAGPVQASEAPAIGLIDFSSLFCTFSIFFKKSLVLLRRFDFGTDKILKRITTSLNVDENTAINILMDGAFDISDLLTDIMQPFFSQLVVSRDFIERRDNCSISNLYLTGTLAVSDAAIQHIERSLNVSVTPWDPFDLPNMSLAAPLDPQYDKQRWQFASAIGVALAVLQEDA